LIVYALIDPRTERIRYVGQTMRSARRRLRRHLAPCYLTGTTRKEKWLRELVALGLEPRIEVLQACTTAAAMDVAERHHIASLRAAGEDLTNLARGGADGGCPHTPESREKIRRALLGKPKSEEHRRRSGLASRGRRASDATRALLSAQRKGRPGRPPSDSERVHLSRAKGGRPFVDQHGNRYETQKGAARALGINVGHLNEVLHGRRHTVRGYVFRFVSEFPA
jgi:hypothetical protein